MQTLDLRNVPDSVMLHQEARRQRSLLMAELLRRGMRRIAMWMPGAAQPTRRAQRPLPAGRVLTQG
ncbi:MAG: hypothetical protein ABI593_01420 [Betaproteobacteria bacterium]